MNNIDSIEQAGLADALSAMPVAGRLSRRRMLQGAGLMLVVTQSGRVFAQDKQQVAPAKPAGKNISETEAPKVEKKYGGDAMPGGLVDDPLVFVSIAPDGIVSVTCIRSEMGQGVRTSIPMVVADELDADWAKVRVVQAPGDETRYGNQNTDGSRSLRQSFMPLRRAGAAMRAMLEAAAAAQWNVPAGEVTAKNHELVHAASGRRIGYGAVAQAAAKLPVPAEDALKLKQPADFRYIGKADLKLLDGEDIVRGRAGYGIDTRLDGMVYAVVARPPVLGGRLKHYDDKKTLAVPGVIKVVELKSTPLPAMMNPLGGVAVVAKNTWAAMQGRDALVIEWEGGGDHANYDSIAFKKTLEDAARKSWAPKRNDGDAVGALSKAAKKIEAEYYVPHLAHAAMEPVVATARIDGDRCEVWAPVQAPHAAKENVAASLGMKPEQVTVHVTMLGGGFGRKSMTDFISEAALISKAMDGKPVKLQWSRPDDIQHDYFHAVALEHMEAVQDDQGKTTAWLHRSAAPTINSTFAKGAMGLTAFELGMGAVNVPFQIANLRVEAPEVPAHTRIGWFRSVYNVPHVFAVQSFVAELAHAAGRDQKDYLLELIGPARKVDPAKMSDSWNYGESPERYQLDTGRMRHVVELAAKGAGWGRDLPKGRGLGIAVAYSFVSYTACAIEVEVGPKGELQIVNVNTSIDCGPHVNPERIRAQMEGAVVMGLSLAMRSQITFKNGAVDQSNFNDFVVLRNNESPRKIAVHLVPVTDFSVPLGGVGEPGLPPVAPALTNAIFAATGKRIRTLPIGEQLKSA